MKNKQFIVRNLVWNKHYTDVLKDKNDNTFTKIAENLLNALKNDTRIKYCLFSIERGEKQNNRSFHFQGYLEFNKRVDVVAFNKIHKFTDVQARKGTQQQAISYVKKPTSKLTETLFEFGNPKGNISRYNTSDREIPDNLDDQRILLDQRLERGEYPIFEDIKKDFTLLFLKFEKWTKNLWIRYNRTEMIDIKYPKVIWCWGDSGVGKTHWTAQYLKNHNYQNKDISFKKASDEREPKLWFTLNDEGCKVLWIEEVRLNFPSYNNMIQFIDKRDHLPVKGTFIVNTFELIIINSLLSPDEVYNNLKNINRREVLRRIYFSTPENKILKFEKGTPHPPIIVDKSKELPGAIKDLEYLRSK